MDNLALGQDLLLVLVFPFSVSVHQYSILVFFSLLSYPDKYTLVYFLSLSLCCKTSNAGVILQYRHKYCDFDDCP